MPHDCCSGVSPQVNEPQRRAKLCETSLVDIARWYPPPGVEHVLWTCGEKITVFRCTRTTSQSAQTRGGSSACRETLHVMTLLRPESTWASDWSIFCFMSPKSLPSDTLHRDPQDTSSHTSEHIVRVSLLSVSICSFALARAGCLICGC